MYANQWFLTVFTAKFPLYLVFRVLDVFLLDGFDAIFQVQRVPALLGLWDLKKKPLRKIYVSGTAGGPLAQKSPTFVLCLKSCLKNRLSFKLN